MGIGRANTAMAKLSFLLLSMAVLWIALTLATPSAAEQVGDTDLIMGLRTLNRGLRSADAKRKGGTIKKARREKEEKTKKGTRGKNLDEGQRPKSLQRKEIRRTKILEKEGTGRRRRERRAMAKGKKETPRRIKILEKEETES